MTTLTLLDGGMGKTLETNGAPFRQPEWSALALIEDPRTVMEAHRQFVDAGAQVITTNNYAVAPFHLGRDRFDADGRSLTKLAGELARQAAGTKCQVAGSLPPLYGSYEPDLFEADHAAADLAMVVEALAPNVDLFLAETQSSLEEGGYSLRAASASGKPMWISFTLNELLEDGKGLLRSGESITDAASLASDLGAEAILFNCSRPEVMSAALAEVAATGIEMRRGAYANSFVEKQEGYAANNVILGHRDDLDPEGYAEFAVEWIADGAHIVGGCCGIMPSHIAELASRLSPT